MPGFNVDEAPNDASLTAELFATVRSNGRILDDFKCVLGGTDCLEAEFNLAKLFEDPTLGSHSIQIQRWPRDLDLRKGLLSGLLRDVSAFVFSRDASVIDKEGAGVTANEFLRMLEQSKAHAAARWAVVLADNEKLALQLQGLQTAVCPGANALVLRIRIQDPIFLDTWIQIQDPRSFFSGSIPYCSVWTNLRGRVERLELQ